MSISANDFLLSADHIASIDPTEIYQRNAISRGYYAAYHRAIEYIAPDKKDRGLGQHRSYLAQLEEHDAGTLERRLGVSLSVAYSHRITADYRLYRTVSTNDFSSVIRRVRSVFDLTEPLTSSVAPTSPTSSDTTPDAAAKPARPTLKIIK